MKIRIKVVKEASSSNKISFPFDIVMLLKRILKGDSKFARDQEHFWVVGLDGANHVKYVDLVSLGLVNRSLVHPREVFRLAIHEGISSVILAHNHPSGSIEPSQDDVAITRQLKEAGKIVGIAVLDHVIISNEPDAQYYSFKEHETL